MLETSHFKISYLIILILYSTWGFPLQDPFMASEGRNIDLFEGPLSCLVHASQEKKNQRNYKPKEENTEVEEEIKNKNK